MIETIRDLAQALSAEAATVDLLTERLGPGTDVGGTVVVEKPRLDGVARAGIVRQVQGGEPALVTLELSVPQPLDELETSFGPPRQIHPDHIGEPLTLVYELDMPGQPYTVALLATDDGGAARKLTLRRDIRLA